MATCSRHWEAEAVRDGRLRGAEASSFLRHASSCAECSAQIASLDRLGAALRELPAPPRDALTARRSRRAILQRLDEQQLRPERRPAAARLVLAAGALAAVAAIGLGWRSSRAPAPAALSVEVVPRGQAVWSERRAGPRRELILESGEILVKVANKARADSLVLLTPDAEIEDIGTIFSVQVADGATREVRVVEGAVNIRRHGAAPQVVVAGDHWSAPVASVALIASAAPVTPDAPAQASASPAVATAPSASPSPAVTVPSSTGAVARPVAHAAASSSGDAPLSEFEQAMALFRAGQLTSAASRFDAFARRHPGEARAEDASYLSVVALSRSGQAEAARQAAAGYLARYPGGLRAREVQALTR